MELTKKDKKKLKYTSDVIRLDKKHLTQELKNYVRVLKSEMNVLSNKMLDDKSKGMDFHTAIWALKYRVDEIEGRVDDRKENNGTSSGAGSSDTKVSK
jgi:hypothetical protein|tara:strand:- start:678 stop:971 length:294 start_codon:yes stop_codon:yes gene_type:complete